MPTLFYPYPLIHIRLDPMDHLDHLIYLDPNHYVNPLIAIFLISVILHPGFNRFPAYLQS